MYNHNATELVRHSKGLSVCCLVYSIENEWTSAIMVNVDRIQKQNDARLLNSCSSYIIFKYMSPMIVWVHRPWCRARRYKLLVYGNREATKTFCMLMHIVCLLSRYDRWSMWWTEWSQYSLLMCCALNIRSIPTAQRNWFCYRENLKPTWRVEKQFVGLIRLFR